MVAPGVSIVGLDALGPLRKPTAGVALRQVVQQDRRNDHRRMVALST